MWVKEYTAECAASPAQVFSILAEPARWSEWNAGVRRIDMHGPFAEGTTAVMVLPDETALPFRFTWIEVDRGCEVDGPADVAAEVGAAVSADFPDVISALGARAEGMG